MMRMMERPHHGFAIVIDKRKWFLTCPQLLVLQSMFVEMSL
jgi:hypothetical protein